MTHSLTPTKFGIVAVPLKQEFVDDPRAWLATYAAKHPALNLCYLLAHADDGVMWGVMTPEGRLNLSGDHFETISPPLQAKTLQQLRLFGSQGELHLWRVAPLIFQARLVDETVSETETCRFDERQILWGDRRLANQNGFTLVGEGQGLRHAVPMEIPDHSFGPKQRPLRLTVRHYLTYDDLGQARIYLSRLVDLNYEDGGENE